MRAHGPSFRRIECACDSTVFENGMTATVATAADGSTNAVVARLNSNGSLDGSFGQDSSDGTPDGVVSVSLGNGDDSAEAIALQADGKILIAGNHVASDKSSNIFVARLVN